jgi:porphobilinogen synthase
MGFPEIRLRRLRRTDAIRALVRETALSPGDLVLPVFVDPALSAPAPVPSMPGVERIPVRRAGEVARSAQAAGLGALLLFGQAREKGPEAPDAVAEDAAVPEALRRMKEAAPGLVLLADVCLCAYTDHGHCGVLGPEGVENDPSLALLARAAVNYARAGADFVAPSDMMDGRVGAIRRALDGEGFASTGILAYAAKYASAFYGPFREAQSSAPRSGDRRSYQMDPGNVREAMREIGLDVAEGADVVMVKPALAYLDVIRAARERFDVPVAAYSVSGEYAALKAAAERGWLDERACVLETLLAMRRAGADLVVTYHALDAARWLG